LAGQRKSRLAIVVVAVKTKALSAWRYVSPFKRFGSGSAWRYVSHIRRFCCNRLVLCLLWYAWSIRLIGYLKGRLAGIPWVELGIGVKHMAFLELSSEWHPSSWARDGGWTRGTLELSSGCRVLPVWVCWLWPVRMGPDRLPSSVVDWRVW